MNKGFKKLFITLIMSCLVFSFAGVALAQDNNFPPPPEHHGDMPKPDPAAMEKHITQQLHMLVNKGTIDQDQADKVLNFWREKAKERQAEHEKIKDMSPEERHAYMEQKKKNPPDIIGELIKNIGLSEEQAKAVADALRPPAPPLHGAPDCKPKSE